MAPPFDGVPLNYIPLFPLQKQQAVTCITTQQASAELACIDHHEP